MKKITFIFLVIALFSCKAIVECDLSSCTGDCIFIVEDVEVMTKNIPCYGQYGFVYKDSLGDQIILLPDEISIDLQKDSINLIICGYARENKKPFLFPDPPGPLAYQFRTESVVMPSR